jgi:hypothetical protein
MIKGATWDDPINWRIIRLIERLDHSWFHTRLRARIADRDRQEQKDLRIARGVRLYCRWVAVGAR